MSERDNSIVSVSTMAHRGRINLEMKVVFTPELLADAFAQMEADDQAEFLIEVATRFAAFDDNMAPAGNLMQIYAIASNLVGRMQMSKGQAEMAAQAIHWIRQLADDVVVLEP